MAQEFVLAGKKIPLGKTKAIQLKFSETYHGNSVSVPVHVIRSRKPGPTICFTGGIHGDELAGIGIIRTLLFDKHLKLLKGNVICVPTVNVYGLEMNSRYLPDRRDLNRSFPGSEMGSITGRLAHVIYSEVVSKCQYAVDFHSAAVRRTNYPNVRADMSNPKVKELAEAFGCEVIVNGKGPTGSLRRTCVSDGIPNIILEAGEVWKTEPGVVEVGVRGSLNILKHLGMIEGEKEPPLFQLTVKKTSWIRADRGGFLHFHAQPGDLVSKGEVLATNTSVFGSERKLIHAKDTGIVLGMSTMPAIKPGEPVYHIAKLTERKFREINRLIGKSDNEHLYTRIMDDLSTNIDLKEK